MNDHTAGRGRRRKLLLSAYACEPHRGSEQGVGWHHAVHLARYHDVWCITSGFQREAIEEELAANPVPGLTFVYVDLLPSHPRVITGYRIQFHYYAWQLKAGLRARKLHRRIGFDLTHHVSYIRCWSPTFLSTIDAPLVWGPVAGAEKSPIPFWPGLLPLGGIFEVARTLVVNIARLDPVLRRTAHRAALTLATSTQTVAYCRGLGARDVRLMPPSLAPDDAVRRPVVPPSDRREALRFVSIGRLAAWKGTHLAIRALAQPGLEKATYDVVGTGPRQPRLEALARRLGVADRVRFHDVDRETMFQLLEDADVLIHMGLHDPGPTVLFEALAAGRPFISLDMGAGTLFDDVAITIEPTTPRKVVRVLAAAMRELSADPVRRTRMGRRGRQLAEEELNWAARGRQLADLHEQVLSRATAPSPA